MRSGSGSGADVGAKASGPILDDERLSHLSAQLGRLGFARLIGRFGPASKTELERLDEALRVGASDKIRSAAHRIAGFASNFGARGLALLARELEAHPEDADSIAPQLRAFVASTDLALNEQTHRERDGEAGGDPRA